MQIVSDILLIAVAAVAAVTDLTRGRIYNWLVYPAFVVGLLLAAAGGAEMLKDHALAAAVGFAVMLAAYMLGGMGGGDVKLVAVAGMFIGWSRGGDIIFATMLFYTFAIAVVIGLVAALWRGVMGVAVARTWLGMRIYAMRGTTLDDALPRPTIRVPFGFAMLPAAVWALSESYAQVTIGSLLMKVLGA